MLSTLLFFRRPPLRDPRTSAPLGSPPLLIAFGALFVFSTYNSGRSSCTLKGSLAYRHGVDLQKDNLRKAVLEAALLTGQDLFCVSFDLQKAFDHVPHSALLLLMERLALPKGVLGLLRHRLTEQQQHWKLFGSLSPPRTMARGLIQGCALSCLYFNMMMVPLLRSLQHRQDCDPLNAHADDLFLTSSHQEKADRTILEMRTYLRHLRIPIQGAKTQCLGIGHFTKVQVRVGDDVVSSQSQVRVLGQDLCSYVPSQGSLAYQEREQRFRLRLNVIRRLKLPTRVRLLLLKTMAYPLLDFCPWQAPLVRALGLRTSVVDLLYPNIPTHRASEILTLVLNPAHTVDPFCTMFYRLLVYVGERLRANPQEVQQFPVFPAPLGPYGVIVAALESIGLRMRTLARVQVGTESCIDLVMPQNLEQQKRWLHDWRQVLRSSLMQQLACRRPVFADLQNGVDKGLSALLYNIVQEDPQRRYHVAMTLSGAQITGSLLFRQGKQQDECPFCQAPEDGQMHLFWECPQLEEMRMAWFPVEPFRTPPILRSHGLVPLAHQVDPVLVLRIQSYQLAVSMTCSLLALGRQEGSERIPTLEDFVLWTRHKLVREARPETPLQLPPLPLLRDDDGQIQQIAGHMVRRHDAISFRCEDCGRSYTLSHLHRFAYTECNMGVRQATASALPPVSRKIDDSWSIPRHCDLPHAYALSADSSEIQCTRCNALWKWRQRHQLPRCRCVGTVLGEQERRRVLDEGLPLIRSGHTPRIHPRFCALECTTCGHVTHSESLRGFDGVRCVGPWAVHLGRHALRNLGRLSRFTCDIGQNEQWLAKCRHCEFSSPWHVRKALFAKHRCQHRP